VNPTATINGNEHVIMGGGFSPVVLGFMTNWKTGLFYINPLNGQLDLILGLKPTGGGIVDYSIIVHMYLYQTATQWSIFTLENSR